MSKDELITRIFPKFHRLVNKFDEIRNQRYEYDEKVSLYPGEIHTLTAVADHPGSTISEVGYHMGITKSAASQFLIKLEGKGLIEKSRMPENNKNIILSLSPLGRDVLHEFRAYWNSLFSEAFDHLKKIDEESLQSMLTAFDVMEAAMDRHITE